MKFWNKFLKVVASLAAVAAVVYVVINYGDKIIAWTKRTFKKNFPCCCDCCEEELPEEALDEAPSENVAEEADFEA